MIDAGSILYLIIVYLGIKRLQIELPFL